MERINKILKKKYFAWTVFRAWGPHPQTPIELLFVLLDCLGIFSFVGKAYVMYITGVVI